MYHCGQSKLMKEVTCPAEDLSVQLWPGSRRTPKLLRGECSLLHSRMAPEPYCVFVIELQHFGLVWTEFHFIGPPSIPLASLGTCLELLLTHHTQLVWGNRTGIFKFLACHCGPCMLSPRFINIGFKQYGGTR